MALNYFWTNKRLLKKNSVNQSEKASAIPLPAELIKRERNRVLIRALLAVLLTNSAVVILMSPESSPSSNKQQEAKPAVIAHKVKNYEILL